jgi:hypothetical protein
LIDERPIRKTAASFRHVREYLRREHLESFGVIHIELLQRDLGTAHGLIGADLGNVL